MRARGDLLARYERGEHEAVWRELRALGAVTGDLREEALAVARATMARAAHAAGLLLARLRARGWEPGTDFDARTPPRPGDAATIAAVVALTGAALPPSLLAFWEVVGGVNFCWDWGCGREPPDLLPGVRLRAMDPLQVDPVEVCDAWIDEWHAANDACPPDRREPFVAWLAPDLLHKQNVSGAGPYGITLPFAGADPVFEDDGVHDLPFVDYLRLAVRCAGFPLLGTLLDDAARESLEARNRHAARALRETRASRGAVEAFVREYTRGLEAF